VPDAGDVPSISVVVPIYNVEPYLAECLESLLAQSAGDLEVVMVDDGSTDGSAAIAERYAELDSRLRLVRQANHGLGHARNTGVAAANGDYLAFADSDDVVPEDAYARLLASLERTGSDFACGNVHRFTAERTWPAQWLRKTFLRTRRRTHVTRFRWLLSDRMAQNKLWRRSFWDEHRLRFPEGCVHEDIPVTVPAHGLARSVDVLSAPVYLYRRREGSITHHRAEVRTLRDRVAAVEHARALLPETARRWYDESVLEEDLRYHLDVLDEAGDEYRALFLDAAGAWLDRAGEGVEDPLPAIQRLKWHLVRRRLADELIEVLRFQRAEMRRRPRAVIGGRVYGDYPFLRDEALAVPRSVYRLDMARRRTAQAITLLKPCGVGRTPEPAEQPAVAELGPVLR
jgi:CDP-glycerol glycerophosphotransferase